MPYVSHTHIYKHIYRTTHYATILTRSVCPSHITVLLEAATACLLAYSRSDFDHESETSIWEQSEKLSPCHRVFYRTLTRQEFEIKEKPLRQEGLLHLKNMIISYLSLLFDVIFDVNNYTNSYTNVTWFYI